jgi:hypothetical protein
MWRSADSSRRSVGSSTQALKLVRIEPLSAARVCAALYFAFGLLLPLFIFLVDRPSTWSWAHVVMTLMVPFAYAVLGALMGGVGAWIYNAVALRFGGLEVSLSRVAQAQVDQTPDPRAGVSAGNE